jgi:hypothetical protein
MRGQANVVQYQAKDLVGTQRRTVLFVDDSRFPNERDRVNARKLGFEVRPVMNLDIWESFPNHIHDFGKIVFKISRSNIERVLRNIRLINDAKISEGVFLPHVVVIPAFNLPKSCAADFGMLGCSVLPSVPPAQLFELFSYWEALCERLEARGLSIWVPRNTGLPVLVGQNGLVAEVDFGGRLQKLFDLLLANAPGVAYVEDLASQIGCSMEEVKVYVQRLRQKVGSLLIDLGVHLPVNQVIQTLPGGYRLHARPVR